MTANNIQIPNKESCTSKRKYDMRFTRYELRPDDVGDFHQAGGVVPLGFGQFGRDNRWVRPSRTGAKEDLSVNTEKYSHFISSFQESIGMICKANLPIFLVKLKKEVTRFTER